MKKFPTHISIIILLFLGQLAIGQNTSIVVRDKKNSEPISYANVILYNMDNTLHKGLTTDDKGIAKFEISKEVKYEISFIGYADKRGTISPGKNLEILMGRDSEILDAVVVTGQHEAKRADKSIYKIDVVNSVQLQERGVSNLADALSNETNIRLSVDPATGTSIVMNGMGGENVKYLIDGVPIVGRVNGNIDLSQINMDNVDHIEIVQGPMSVVYGTSALAGVINIITKQNTRNRNSINANTYIDNKNNYNVGVNGSVIRGTNTFSLSGQRNMFQGVNLDESTRSMKFNPELVYNADAEYAYRKNDFSLRLKTSYMNDEVIDNGDPDTLTNGLASDTYFTTIRSATSINVSDKISDKLSYNVIGAYTYFGRSSEFFRKNLRDTISGGLDILEQVSVDTSFTRFDNYMTRGTFTYIPSSELSFQFGWDINHDTGDGDKIIGDEKTMTDYSAFASAQWTPIEGFSIQPGARFIYNTNYEAPVVPSINFQYQFTDNFSARMSYAKGFRAPSLKELYLYLVNSSHNIQGNDSLKAESTNSYNASILYKIKSDNYQIKIEPSIFYNDGKDKISMVIIDEETLTAKYFNIGSSKIFGYNFNVKYLHYVGLTLGVGINGTGELSNSNNMDDLVYYQNYTVNAKYNFNKLKLVLMANYKLYGKTPRLSPEPGSETEFYYVYTDPYSDLEISLSKMLWKNRLSVVVGAKNLFDNYYKTTKGYKEDPTERYSVQNYGRTYFVRMNFKLSN